MPRAVPPESLFSLRRCRTLQFQSIRAKDMKRMTFFGSSRLLMLLSAGMLGACLMLASTLPGPAAHPGEETVDAASSAMLPRMMDASGSFTDTGTASPAASQAPMDTLHARSADGPPSNGANG